MAIKFLEAKGRVKKIENKGNYVKAQFSTVEKGRNGEWVYSNWQAMFVGQCAKQAATLSDNDKITVKSGKISHIYLKEHNKSFTNMAIFAFEAEDAPKKQADDFEDFRTFDDDDSMESIPF